MYFNLSPFFLFKVQIKGQIWEKEFYLEEMNNYIP